MGDPRRLRKKYETPMHPWRSANIEAERAVKREYALKNKQELWRMAAVLRNFKNQAKKLIAQQGTQADLERKQLLSRLERLGLLPTGAKLDSVLSLQTKDILDRRLQSFVFKQGIARSIKQARQFITHYHIAINGKIVSAPGYIVTKADENTIQVRQTSSLVNPDHPERVPIVKKIKKRPAPVEKRGYR
ncbi:MAG TPA: 30S ribosomal protein S4 [Candidatus Nanoarchaeia archaeon]|nr:30S ribosomal protein S4 [Candidatus Nanoarchaeia archaeon]